MDYASSAEGCLESARRGADWLQSQQAPDGSWSALQNAPIDAYYKAAWAFNITGRSVATERTINYVKRNLLRPDGDLLPRNDQWYINVHYQYQNAWVTIGSQKQGRYDIAAPALRFLLTQQDKSHGGFYSQRSNNGERKRSDTMSSGISGIACLASGQLEAAQRLAGYFEKMVEWQPEPKSKFYLTVDERGRLATSFPNDEAEWRVVDAKQKDQCWYAVGLPFTFAILLNQSTGEKRYAELAKWYLDFQLRCVNPWDGGSSGKAGWGCSMLYRSTGEERYREISLRVAKNEMNSQLPDGSFQWRAPEQQGGYDDTTPGVKRNLTSGDFDVTSEFVVWLSLIGSNLLARETL